MNGRGSKAPSQLTISRLEKVLKLKFIMVNRLNFLSSRSSKKLTIMNT